MEGIVFDNSVMCRANSDSGAQQLGGAKEQQGGIEEQSREVKAEESDSSGTDSESEVDGEEGFRGRFGVNTETYKRKMVIRKNKIIGKG